MSSVATGAGTPGEGSVCGNEKGVFTHPRENEASAAEGQTLELAAWLTGSLACLGERLCFRLWINAWIHCCYCCYKFFFF